MSKEIPNEYVPVLVVGGSLVGLSAALFLRRQGVEVLLVERHPGTSIHPRTPGYNARTMELFRAAGVEDAVRAAGPWQLDGSGLLWAESLTSDRYRWLEPASMRGPRAEFAALSPTRPAVLAQDVLEPVLREHAGLAGADLRYGTELESCTRNADGVTAILRDRDSGERRRVTADYLIAADGADSGIREWLGIDRDGVGVLEHKVGIMVRADLGDALRHKNFVICQVENDSVSAMVRVIGDRISLNVDYDPARGETVEQFTPQRCVELTRAVTGIPDLEVELLDIYPWQPSAAVAGRFTDDRVFLAGDAAHVMPPSGAFGANTGIQDAYNLAWKLGYVLRGLAGPELLDSYDRERRPIAELTVEQAMARGRAWFGADYPGEAELIDDDALMFGYRYGGAEPVENPRSPTGVPGSRLPHAWLDDAEQRSTVDIWAAGLALFTGPDGAAWAEAADTVDLELRVVSVGKSTWSLLGGTAATGAILVRPDGFIAWHSETPPEHPEQALRSALQSTMNIHTTSLERA